MQELRNKMQAIDADQNLRMALIEFLLFNYGKSVDEFLNPPFEVPEELLAALEQATAAHRAYWRERAERDALYENLERTSTVGGVKGMRAKAEPTAASPARALWLHSACSDAGTESCTIPAPAWMWTRPFSTSSVRIAMQTSMDPPWPK